MTINLLDWLSDGLPVCLLVCLSDWLTYWLTVWLTSTSVRQSDSLLTVSQLIARYTQLCWWAVSYLLVKWWCLDCHQVIEKSNFLIIRNPESSNLNYSNNSPGSWHIMRCKSANGMNKITNITILKGQFDWLCIISFQVSGSSSSSSLFEKIAFWRPSIVKWSP